MAIHVYVPPKPNLWAEATAGGDLPANTTFYLIGFFFRGSGYYGISSSPVSDEISVTTDSTNKTITLEWYQDGGDVSSFTDNGSGGTTVHSTAHGLSSGDKVDIRGTTNYDGDDYTISNVTTDTYDISTAYVADETGKWFKDKGNPTPSWTTNTNYIYLGLKWDYYSMINSSTGKPYRWCNLNDPNYTSEYQDGYGHKRWTVRYYAMNDGYSSYYNGKNTLKRVDDAYSGSTWDKHSLYDGTTDSTMRGRVNSKLYVIGVGIQDDPSYCALNSHFSRDDGQMIVYFDSTDTKNTTKDLVKALVDSGYDNLYWVDFESNSGWMYNDSEWNIQILGSCYKNDSTVEINLDDATITLWQGEFFNNSYSNGYDKSKMVGQRSKLVSKTIGQSMWTNLYVSVPDSTLITMGNAMILDSSIYDNTTIKPIGGSPTFYMKSSGGVKLIGGYGGAPVFMQWRYQRVYDTGEPSMNPDDWTIVNNVTSHFWSSTINHFYLYYVEDGTGDKNGYMSEIKFENADWSGHGYDVSIQYNYIDGDKDVKMICRNVTSNRSDGKVKVYVGSISTSHTFHDVWEFWYFFDLTVVDKDGNPISGVDVKVDYGSGSKTGTTDANGQVTVGGLSYTLEYDSSEGKYVYYTDSDFNTITLTLSKSGYETYTWEGTMKEGKTWTITLKESKTTRMDTSGNLYFNLDKPNEGKVVDLQPL